MALCMSMCVRSFARQISLFHPSKTLTVTNYRPVLHRMSTAAETQTGKTENKDPASPETQKDQNTAASEEPHPQVLELKTVNEKLQKELDDAKDKYKRSLAEAENVRRRMLKQVDDAKLFGIQGFCKDLLEVADILGKATEATPKDQLTKENPHLVALYEGLTMTDSQLHKVLTKNGLSVINPPEGDKFDPFYHEALFQQPLVEGKKPGTVAAVTKVGYMLHSRTIRPALVGVFKNS